MKKKYITPHTFLTSALARTMLATSWAVDGERHDGKEGNPDGDIDTRKRAWGNSLWED